MQAGRADLFRLLGDEDRLRLLALCAEEELTVGELAQLLGESQPQVTKKSQPLREAGLLSTRRDGTRTLLKIDERLFGARRNHREPDDRSRVPHVNGTPDADAADPVIAAALERCAAATVRSRRSRASSPSARSSPAACSRRPRATSLLHLRPTRPCSHGLRCSLRCCPAARSRSTSARAKAHCSRCSRRSTSA